MNSPKIWLTPRRRRNQNPLKWLKLAERNLVSAGLESLFNNHISHSLYFLRVRTS
jgi:hypothetical protein